MKGPTDRRCLATSRSGERCKRPAALGAVVCHSHGAAAPQVAKKAAERLAEASAHRLLARYSLEPVTDPVSALAAIAGEVLAWKRLLANRLAELGAVDQWIGRPEVAVFERALDRVARVLGDIARLDLGERLVRVDEAKAEMLAAVVLNVLTSADLGLDPEQQATGRRLIAGELRALAAAEASL